MWNIVTISLIDYDLKIGIGGAVAKYSIDNNVLTYTSKHGVLSKPFRRVIEACEFLMELTGIKENINVWQQ